MPDHAERLAALDFEVDVAQRPELAILREPSPVTESLGDLLGEQDVPARRGADLEALAQAVDLDGDVATHMMSAKKSSARRK